VPTDQGLFERIAPSLIRKDQVGYSRRSRKLRLIQSLKHVPKPIPSLLEIGCGAGFTAEYLEGLYGDYRGIDYSKPLIEAAQKTQSTKKTCASNAGTSMILNLPSHSIAFL